MDESPCPPSQEFKSGNSLDSDLYKNWALLAGWRPGMMSNILQYTGQPYKNYLIKNVNSANVAKLCHSVPIWYPKLPQASSRGGHFLSLAGPMGTQSQLTLPPPTVSAPSACAGVKALHSRWKAIPGVVKNWPPGSTANKTGALWETKLIFLSMVLLDSLANTRLCTGAKDRITCELYLTLWASSQCLG